MNAPRNPRDRSQSDFRNYNSETFIEEKDDFDFREQLDIFWRRRWTILISFFVILGAGAAYTFTRPAVFEAHNELALATVPTSKSPMLDDATSDPISAGLAALGDSHTVDTQVEVMKSPDLLDAAFNSFSDKTKMRGWGATELPIWAWSIESKPDSDVVNIVTKAYTARLSADLANRIAEKYRLRDQAQNKQATTETLNFVKGAMKDGLADLERATGDLAEFKKRTGLVAADTQVQNAANTYTSLQSDKSQSESGLASTNKTLAILRRQLNQQPDAIPNATVVQENPQYTASRTRLQTLQAERADKLQEYVPDAPEIKDLDELIDKEEKNLQSITAKIITSSTTAANPLAEKFKGDYATALGEQAVFQERLRAANSALDRVQRQMQKFPDQQKELALLTQKVTGLTNAYNLLSDNFYKLRIAESSTPSYVLPIAAARAPKYKSYPKTIQNLIGFAFLGILVGLGLAMLGERMDTRVHDPFIVDRITGMTSLSAIPETEPSSDHEDAKLLIGQVENNHAFVESFRLLRNNIMFSSPDREIKLLAVTSPSKSEGKSTVAVNLAIALAMDGKKILIIDCDLRRPTIHNWMGVGREIGLTSVVKKISSLEDAIKPTPFPNLDCLTSGPLPPDPTEFLNSEQTRMIFEQASNLYDVVVLDSPPSTGLSDVQVISTVADGMILVVALNATTKQSLVATTRMLKQANAPMLGTAINRIQYQRSSYGYYAYSYYYYYSAYDEDESPKKKKRRRKKKSTKPPEKVG